MGHAGFDDEAGEQRYAKEVTRCHKSPRDGAVGGARSSVVEMVVAEHDAARSEADGVPEHLVWTDADPVAAARPHDDLLADGPADQRPHESNLHAEAVTDQSDALLDSPQGR
ncbi:MAG: hypothetical protein WCF33_15980 [Pseudonocardiaceae bacterium]